MDKKMIKAMANENSIEVAPMLKYEELKLEVAKLRHEISFLETGSVRKKELKTKLYELNVEICELKKKVKRPSDSIEFYNSMFRGITGRCLPIALYKQLHSYTEAQIKDPLFMPPVLNCLTQEELDLVEKSKKYKEQSESQVLKINKAKSIINGSMPNFIGNIDPAEYKRRMELTKLLTKIIREL